MEMPIQQVRALAHQQVEELLKQENAKSYIFIAITSDAQITITLQASPMEVAYANVNLTMLNQQLIGGQVQTSQGKLR